jgi:hypothetical protein
MRCSKASLVEEDRWGFVATGEGKERAEPPRLGTFVVFGLYGDDICNHQFLACRSKAFCGQVLVVVIRESMELADFCAYSSSENTLGL